MKRTSEAIVLGTKFKIGGARVNTTKNKRSLRGLGEKLLYS
jgi:hypothetical protein